MSTREPEGADITAAYDFFAGKAVEIFNEKKKVQPQLVAVCLGDEPGTLGDMTFIESSLVNDLQETGESKDRLMLFIRLLLSKMGADLAGMTGTSGAPKLVVHLTEAWHLASKSPDVYEGIDSLEDHPDRGEMIMVTVHTAERSFPGMCPISGPKRVATFKPIPVGGEWVGRFVMQNAPGHETH
jgi:hypothetical protein